jgi:DNA-binding Lrp family transcriptional regulator
VTDTQAPITERDHQLLALLAEHRSMVVPQLATALDVALPTAARRVRKLKDRGLLITGIPLEGQPRPALITRAGLAEIGSDLREPTENRAEYRHDIGVGWLHLAAQQGVFGEITDLRLDREMRQHDSRRGLEGQRVAVELDSYGSSGPMRHYPDLLLTTTSGDRVAIELELSNKGVARLEDIMYGYAHDSKVGAVLYLVESDAVARTVAKAARNAGIESQVHVQRLARDAIDGAPAPATGREPARSAVASVGRAAVASRQAPERQR